MTHEKRSPAALAGANRAETISRPYLVIENPNPRQRWRAHLPIRRIAVSDELRAYFADMAFSNTETTP